MPQLPTVVSQISAATGRTGSVVGSRMASPDAFGIQGAEGLDVLGQGLTKLGAGLGAFREKKQTEDAAAKVAQADFTPYELQTRNEVPADGAGYTETVLKKYDDWVDEEANKITDDNTRKIFKERMLSQRQALSSRSATYEFSTAGTHSKMQADDALISLDNKLRLNPDQYDEYVKQGSDLIDTRTDIPQLLKADMKLKWKSDAARARFDGMFDRAKTPEEITAIEQDLMDKGDREWSKELDASSLDQLLNMATSAKSAMLTKADADARAALDTLEARAQTQTEIIPDDELATVKTVVAGSQNPVTISRLARIMRDQDIIKANRHATPEQLAARKEATVSTHTSLPPVVNGAINEAVSMFNVPAEYLAGTVQREYGGYLGGDPATIDYGKGNAEGASSATGIMQFTDSTFLGVMKNPNLAVRIGVDTSGMSDAQILELRKDPRISILAGAAFTEQNKRFIEAGIGRPVATQELYIGHFLGAGGAITLLKAVASNPDASASDLMPDAAAANPSVFKLPNGGSKTVAQLYNSLTASVAGGKSYVQFGDQSTYNKMQDNMKRGLADDPMKWAFGTETFQPDDIYSDTGMQSRGRTAAAVADYYNIPYSEMKPLTQQEADDLTTQMKNGTADDAMGVVTSLQAMGDKMAAAALKQIGVKEPVYGYAGNMAYNTGQTSVAGDIIRGQKRIEENPSIKDQIGATPQEVSSAFEQAVGGALQGLSPSDAQNIRDAALAHYVETRVAKGGAGAFSQDDFAVSVQSVMGATQGAKAVDDVNGTKTVLPRGVTGDRLEQAFNAMSVQDWAAMSPQNVPPRYVTGEIADPIDLADEAKLVAVGGNSYKVALADGSFLITGKVTPQGRLEAFLFSPDPKRVDALAAKADAALNVTRAPLPGPDVPAPSVAAQGAGFDFEAQKRAAEAQGVTDSRN